MNTNATHESRDTVRQRRSDFITYLYRLHRDLISPNTHAAAQARRTLATLRHCFARPRQEVEAYDVIFDFNPPESEQHIWLLAAGLFALHPQPQPETPHRNSLGGAMGHLARERGDAVKRRFTQLVSVEPQALPHYLRQAVQLLRTGNVPMNFYRLLDELIELLADDPHGARSDHRQRIRLTWARDYHRCSKNTAGHTDSSDEATPPPATT